MIEKPTSKTPKSRPTRRTARERLVRLLEKYMAILPPDLRDAVIAARPKPETVKLKAAALNGDPEPGPYTIWGPDAATVYVDRDRRAHCVEDLEPDLRQEVEAAIERSKTEDAALPSNEYLREASLRLNRRVRHLPTDEQQAIIVAAARGLVDLEVRVRDDHRPPLTVERYAAMMCPNCLLFANSAQIPPTLARALVRAGNRARATLDQRYGEAEVVRRQTAIAQQRLWIAQGRVEPPALPERGVAAAGGTAGGEGGG